MENNEVDYMTFKMYEAAMNHIISWAENCKEQKETLQGF